MLDNKPSGYYVHQQLKDVPKSQTDRFKQHRKTDWCQFMMEKTNQPTKTTTVLQSPKHFMYGNNWGPRRSTQRRQSFLPNTLSSFLANSIPFPALSSPGTSKIIRVRKILHKFNFVTSKESSSYQKQPFYFGTSFRTSQREIFSPIAVFFLLFYLKCAMYIMSSWAPTIWRDSIVNRAISLNDHFPTVL